MADRAIELLNDLLKIFRSDSGEYLNLVGDSDRATSLPPSDVKVNDVNTGAVSNPLEYLRLLGRFYVNQMNLQLAVGSWLAFLGKTVYKISRPQSSTDADYRTLVEVRVLGNKCSPVMILEAVKTYCSPYPTMVEGLGGAFCDVSFADCYRDFDLPGVGVVRAATLGSSAYFFRIFMSNVDPAKYKEIVDIVNNYKADGIAYDIVIS